jgi:predicted cobalt transporter CbtA
MGFAKFMTSMLGRGIRIVVGMALVLAGLLTMHGATGIILAVVGLVPLLAGILNVCVFAPLFGGPFNGRDVQK